MWHWLSIMNPHIYTYGFTAGVPIIAMTGAITLVMWAISAEPKRLPRTAPCILLIAFTAWISITTIFAVSPEAALEKWIQVIKILGMVAVSIAVTTTRMRLVALSWIVAISVGFWGAKGGIWAILTGGGSQVLGPGGSLMSDNNQFGLGLLMALPFCLFLAEIATARFVKLGTLGVAGLVGIATIFTYSRGAALGLAVVCLLIWWSSRRRVMTAVIFALVVGGGFQYVPEKWFSRIETIKAQDGEDAPTESRLHHWQQAINMGNASPVVGYGFKSFFNYGVFMQHRPDDTITKMFEAHSIYFQVLGEHGYVGLFIFIALGASYLWMAHRIYRRTKRIPDLFWAHRMARALFLSGIAFAVSGAFLSQAYFDLYYLIVAMLVCLDRIVREGEYAPKPDTFPRLVEMTRINTEAYGLGPLPERPAPGATVLARN